MTLPDHVRARIRLLFFREHWKVGTIATQLGVHPDAVRKALDTASFTNKHKSRPSALDPYVPFVTETLKTYPRLTATRMHEMITQRGYTGSVVQLRRRIRALGLRPKPTSEAFFRLHTLPGEQAQVDWAYYGKIRVGKTERKLWLFVMVLSWSRAVHVCFYLQMDVAAVLRGHVEAFEAFGGVTRTILYDNMKTVVIELQGDAIRFHPRFLDLSGHYLFSGKPCNPARGNEKGRVERRIRDLRSSFIAGRHFVDLDDMRRQFLTWRDEVAHQRPCPGQPDLTVAQALEQERPRLLSLPLHPIDTDDIRTTVPRKQPYVRYDTNLYSVPHNLVGEPLTLSVSDQTVRVLHQDEEVARHDRCWERQQVIEEHAHLEGLVDYKRKAAMARGRNRLLREVPEAQRLYSLLAERNEPMGPQTHALLKLLEHHSPDELAQAIDEAIERGTPRASSVAAILDQRRRAHGEPPVAPISVSDRPEIRDLRVRNHNLEDYDALIDHDDRH